MRSKSYSMSLPTWRSYPRQSMYTTVPCAIWKPEGEISKNEANQNTCIFLCANSSHCPSRVFSFFPRQVCPGSKRLMAGSGGPSMPLVSATLRLGLVSRFSYNSSYRSLSEVFFISCCLRPASPPRRASPRPTSPAAGSSPD